MGDLFKSIDHRGRGIIGRRKIRSYYNGVSEGRTNQPHHPPEKGRDNNRPDPQGKSGLFEF